MHYYFKGVSKVKGSEGRWNVGNCQEIWNSTQYFIDLFEEQRQDFDNAFQRSIQWRKAQ